MRQLEWSSAINPWGNTDATARWSSAINHWGDTDATGSVINPWCNTDATGSVISSWGDTDATARMKQCSLAGVENPPGLFRLWRC